MSLLRLRTLRLFNVSFSFIFLRVPPLFDFEHLRLGCADPKRGDDPAVLHLAARRGHDHARLCCSRTKRPFLPFLAISLWTAHYDRLLFKSFFFFFGLFRILDLSKRANSDFSSAFPGFRDERGILEISATPPTEDERECTEAPVPQHACTFLEGGGRVEVNTTTERGKTGERMGREMMEIDTMMDMGHMGTMITNSSRTTTPSFTNSYLVEPEGTGFKSNDFCDGTA